MRPKKKRYTAWGVDFKSYRFKWQATLASKWVMFKLKVKNKILKGKT